MRHNLYSELTKFEAEQLKTKRKREAEQADKEREKFLKVSVEYTLLAVIHDIC
jgi:hypothetical protein